MKRIKMWFRRLLNRPMFQHDCNNCIFLGHTLYKKAWCDLYACVNASHPFGNTVIARFDSNGPDYTSGICFGMQAMAEKREHPLRTAIERAKARGIDLGPEADLSKVNYCEKHEVYVVPGTRCWDCGIEEMQEKIKHMVRRSAVMSVIDGGKADA